MDPMTDDLLAHWLSSRLAASRWLPRAAIGDVDKLLGRVSSEFCLTAGPSSGDSCDAFGSSTSEMRQGDVKHTVENVSS